ncbi:MAG: YebC/PmpR family DNA-binding transcriptional regulator, partial [Candidatus Omnitrophica bacterium]|nr:YebC/PmpR family DNA-binding transcriptional regulator [Candidatus Omnitrophota bacterium]
EDKNYEVFTSMQNFETVKQAIQAKGINPVSEELTMVPSSTIKLAGNEAKQLLALVEAIEDHEDVQQVYANFDIPDEILEQVSSE